MAKKKLEKKEEEKLEITTEAAPEKIKVKLGEIEATLKVEGGIIVDIGISRGMFAINRLYVWDHSEVGTLIEVFKKIIAIYEALNVLKGD